MEGEQGSAKEREQIGKGKGKEKRKEERGMRRTAREC